MRLMPREVMDRLGPFISFDCFHGCTPRFRPAGGVRRTITDAGRRALDELVEMTRPRVAPSPAQPADPYDDGGTALLGHSDFNVTLTQQALA
jgi:hypothetical protein